MRNFRVYYIAAILVEAVATGVVFCDWYWHNTAIALHQKIALVYGLFLVAWTAWSLLAFAVIYLRQHRQIRQHMRHSPQTP